MQNSINLELMKNLTVLYVEDEQDIRNNLQSCFSSMLQKMYNCKRWKRGF